MFEEYFDGQQPLDFDDLANLLLEQGSQESPSRLHGGICGVLAGGGSQEPDYCLSAVAQALDMEIYGAIADYGMRLVSITLAALSNEDFDFHLFLPDDEVPMEQRLQSMAAWCNGFLAGFALVIADPASDTLGSEGAEILKDMAAIAEVEPPSEEDEDEDEDEDAEEEAERGYFELTEYLRFACLNLFIERDDAAPGGAQ
jgi:uncharacterized protein YgfB (UPF0149 family)